MESVLRPAGLYIAILILFRLAGRRTLAELTAFDFVLLLIIGEATQQALLGDDFSITNAVIVVTTLIAMDIAFSILKRRAPLLRKIIDGVPMVVVENGRPLEERMRRARIDEADIMETARKQQGVERLDQIKYAILEISGGITVIPKAAPPGEGGGAPKPD